jgi:lipopolysaccharide transport system ATP-binding protein
VDEVLAVGDVEFQKKCLGKMQDVAEKEGRTVLFVSHNLTAIRTLCSRAILLYKGKIVADSSADEAVRTYLSYGGSNILVREWDNEIEAPQNNSIVLRKVSICDEQDNQVSQVYTDTMFDIKIEFYIKEDNSSAGFTVIFYDDENKCILGSINNHEPNWYGKSMPKGNYKSICKIPANFFNNGLFNLSINIFGKNFSDEYMAQEVLRLEILDGGMVRRDYYGNYEGAIRPLFDWITTKK